MIEIQIKEPGGPEVLVPIEASIPEPGEGQVLIEVEASGVNRPDVMQRKGLYPPPPGASSIPGLEVSGTVRKLGKGANPDLLGKSVCALVSGGGYAEWCVAEDKLCLPVPESISIPDAAGIPETFFTVWTNVFQRGRLQKGETLLVHGGSSGIGTTAIQLAKQFGAKVYVTAGTDEKCEYCLKLGADGAFNYRETDFVEEIRQKEKNGIDVVLDMVGGDYFQKNIQLMATEGRLVQIAIQQGYRTELDLRNLLMKRIYLTGSTLRPRTVNQKAEIALELEQKVWPLLGVGKIKPVIHSTFSLSQASDAHQLMEEGSHIGKILLIPKT